MTNWISTSLLVLTITVPLLLQFNCCLAFQASQPHSHRKKLVKSLSSLTKGPKQGYDESLPTTSQAQSRKKYVSSKEMGRRELLMSMAASTIFLPLAAQAMQETQSKSLENMQLGQGSWTKLDEASKLQANVIIPASFATYASRFLINYDEGVGSWWSDLSRSYALLSEEQQEKRLGQSFGSFAASVQLALDSFVKAQPDVRGGYDKLVRLLLEKYNLDDDAKRHIGILCGTLPKDQQPVEAMRRLLSPAKDQMQSGGGVSQNDSDDEISGSISVLEDLTSLLPKKYGCTFLNDDAFGTIQPPISLYEVGVGEEFGQAAIATPFGPLSSNALTRGLPTYSPAIYALFGISGATGCVLTHTVVIPLDVVKTKAQTDPEDFANVFTGASKIVEDEGIQGLFTGAQATLAGYSWYGVSVYPSYTFFKRFLGQTLLPADFAMAHTNSIALAAGAIAAVIASLGLTPLEAARIRVVADPERYKPLGLLGTLQAMANEDPQSGWRATYAGLPSLLTRQVIFGSIKFLAFERACETIYEVWPFLHDATWTALTVSLVAGGFSGALSCVVSQPADAVLTYVAQKNDGKGSLGVIEGCQLMVEESGMTSLFRGLGSRCVWAGSIIAGQFLLYDVFRSYFGVSGEDLSQVFNIQM